MRDILRKAMRRLSSQPDRLSGSILIVTGGFAVLEASHLPFGTLRAPDAGFFPLNPAGLVRACGRDYLCALRVLGADGRFCHHDNRRAAAPHARLGRYELDAQARTRPAG